jgi:hypothetical protein
MRVKPSLLSIGAILLMIIIQVLYLKSLPGSLVRVYYTGDSNDFNKPPADDMTAEYDGYLFNYRIAIRLSDEAEREIIDVLKDRKQADMQMLIDIAAWVRKRMSFEKSGGSDDPTKRDAAHPSPTGGENRGLCDRYASYFAAASQAVGIPARVLELNGHVVAEAFLREAGRWIMVDPTLGYYLTHEGEPLSVAEIISSYKNGNQPKAAVFAATRGDDSLYSTADESTLRGIYLNGFTVVSNQQLGQQQILSYIATTFSLPIAKLQYIDSSSIKIGRKESILRSTLALNLIVFVLLVIITAVNALRQRTVL